MTSNREKKKKLQEGAARLRAKPGWDPANFQRKSPEEQLRDLNQQSRNDETYDVSSDYDDCQEARESSGDPTTLCQQHLAEAMGL